MLIGMWGYIDVVALACAVAALPLFIGLRRSNILDRNNLFGAILLCFAALLHGGFEVLLRSSPHESFAGYLRGGSGERPAMAILLSDTDCPPTCDRSLETHSRRLFLLTSVGNRVPEPLWYSPDRIHLKCDYRAWDHRVARIDAVPRPGTHGLSAWHWESHAEGIFWHALEGGGGLILAIVCAFRFRRARRGEREAAGVKPPRRFPNHWATAIYAISVAAVPGWVGYARLSDWLFQRKATMLLHDVQGLQLRRSSWADARSLRAKWGQAVKADSGCSEKQCDLKVILNHEHPWAGCLPVDLGLSEAVCEMMHLTAGRWAKVEATVRVRDGIVWGKDFGVVVAHREGYALLADATTTRSLGSSHFRYSTHPNAEFGRPDGCEVCEALWARVTPYAGADDVRDAFDFDLSCLDGSAQGCSGARQLMPAAARRIEHRDGLRSAQAPFNWNPTALRVCARDWQNVAVVDVTQVGSQEPDHRHKMEYKLVEMLKGNDEPSLRSSGFDPDNDVGFPCPGRRAIVFWQNRGHILREALVIAPFTEDNLRAVRTGVEEGAANIPEVR
jgi:hypothetical protein